ncbi:MAG: hypothetical protein JNJ54_30845 [Myxococcaceae bacterium]|nr:hypothetical protein [Myxococcaceae bacterium]
MLRTALKWSLVVLELFLAAGAFYGGTQLVRDPSGGLLQMPANQFLTGSSIFKDWLVPGVVLLLANGVFPLVVAGAELRHARWAVLAHLAVGCVLLGWMVVQVAVMGLSAGIQTVFLSLGLVITALAAVNWSLASASLRAVPPHA